jgi:hypothetical protein
VVEWLAAAKITSDSSNTLAATPGCRSRALTDGVHHAIHGAWKVSRETRSHSCALVLDALCAARASLAAVGAIAQLHVEQGAKSVRGRR